MKIKALALISGGIDSPVAAHLMKKREMELTPLYFDNFPYSGKDTKQRAMDAAKRVGFKKMIIVKHGPNLTEFGKNCIRKYQCVLCRRMMFRIAGKLAGKMGYDALVTGENLAQVASQTLQNMYTESEATNVPIFRPLIGMDKNEIIEIGRKIGTYSVSIKPAMCCSFVPRKPSTHALLGRIKEEEKKVDIDKMVKRSLKSKKVMKIV